MAITLWNAYGDHWSANDKVDFDGPNRYIIVHPEVTSLDIRSEVYPAWVDWISRSPDNQMWLPALKYTGFDPIPGGETGGIFFTYNGWKVIIDFNKVAISGVLYSEDFPTAYWSNTLQPLYPATVSALVNTITNYQNVVTGTALSADEVRTAVWSAPTSSMSTSGSIGEFITKKLLTLAKFIGLK